MCDMREGLPKVWARGKIDSLSGPRHTDYEAGVAHPPTDRSSLLLHLDYKCLYYSIGLYFVSVLNIFRSNMFS